MRRLPLSFSNIIHNHITRFESLVLYMALTWLRKWYHITSLSSAVNLDNSVKLTGFLVRLLHRLSLSVFTYAYCKASPSLCKLSSMAMGTHACVPRPHLLQAFSSVALHGVVVDLVRNVLYSSLPPAVGRYATSFYEND